jgi:hypothetical protein
MAAASVILDKPGRPEKFSPWATGVREAARDACEAEERVRR